MNLKYHFCLFAFLAVSLAGNAQRLFERRIIIENGNFYAVEINPETQLAKLYVGSILEPIDSATVYSLPAGMRQRPGGYQPFAWTMQKDTIWCINGTEYAQNTPANSLKAIPLQKLELFDPEEKPMQFLLQAAYANCPIKNYPLTDAYQKYIYADGLYYDLTFYNGVLFEFICIQNEMTVSSCREGKWTSEAAIPFVASAYFSSYCDEGGIHVVSNTGAVYQYPELKLSNLFYLQFNHAVCVEDRDNHSIYFISTDTFSNGSNSINEILKQFK